MLWNSHIRQFSFVLMSALCLSCAQQNVFFIAGTIELQSSKVLPPNANIEITLADVSLADAPMRVIAKKVINDITTLPTHFSLEYDRSLITSGHSYAVSARIQSLEGRLLGITDTRYSVLNTKNFDITKQEEQLVKMVLKPVN